jgi:hypothetical protein
MIEINKEVRGQIHGAAHKWWISRGGEIEDPEGRHEISFIKGAENQDPIAEARGRNAGIQEAIDTIKGMQDQVDPIFIMVHRSIIQEIEKLKR